MPVANYRSIVRGFAKALPERQVTNEDLEKLIETSDEWITQRTGIKSRYWTTSPIATSDLAISAARQTLNSVVEDVRSVDCVIASTITPDFAFPGIGVQIQQGLALETVPAYDIRNQCAGFLYALEMADALVQIGRYRRILVVGAEVQSTGLDVSTRGRDLAVLFGDGAGSCLVERQGEFQVKPAESVLEVVGCELHADGSAVQDLWCENPGSASFPQRVSAEMLENGSVFPKMNGRRVFESAVRRMTEVSLSLLAKHQLQPEQVALVVAHQANLRINQLLGQQLGLAEEKIFNTIQLYGNTTAATIPIGMTDAICSQRIKKDDYVLMPAFGSGFVWGAALLRVLCCALMWCGLLALSESAGAEGKKSEPKKSAGSEAGKAVVPVVAIPPPEVAVRSEVYYRWKPAEQALVGSVGDSALEVLFQEVTAAAPTKEQAIAKLQEQLTLVQFEARHYCQKQHESKAGCLQSKIALMAEQFRSMDFASRKAVKDSIERDCNRQFGTCLVAKIADIEVVEAALPSDLKVGEPVAGSDTPAVAATVLAPDGTAVKPGAAAAIANDPAADRKLPEEEPSAFGLQ